jgi:hypothetical protein
MDPRSRIHRDRLVMVVTNRTMLPLRHLITAKAHSGSQVLLIRPRMHRHLTHTTPRMAQFNTIMRTTKAMHLLSLEDHLLSLEDRLLSLEDRLLSQPRQASLNLGMVQHMAMEHHQVLHSSL